MMTTDEYWATDDEPRYGVHDSAEAVIRHLAAVDHDIDAPPLALCDRRAIHAILDGRAAHDRVVAEAMGQIGNATAIDIYLAERARLRREP